MIGLIDGSETLLVGVEDDEETGGLRLYFKARYLGLYGIVEDEEVMERVRKAWDGGMAITVPTPSADQLYSTKDRP